MRESSLFYIIVNRGKANKLLHFSKQFGAEGGAIFFGEGTVKSTVLDWLGINQTHKEIFMTTIRNDRVPEFIEKLKTEFKLHKKFRGIAFSVPVLKWTPGAENLQIFDHEAYGDVSYYCVMTVINQGKGKACIEKAREAGAVGGTVIHAHGAGVPKDFYFPLMIEPQKEIVLTVVPKEKLNAIRKAVFEGMGLDQKGSGIILTLPVLETIGLYEKNKERGRDVH